MAASSALEQERAGVREISTLLVPSDGEDAAVHHRRWYKAVGVAAVALGVVAVLAMSGSHLRRFASRGTVVLSEEKGAEDDDLKEGYHYEQLCGIDFKLQDVEHNNLGGAGPDKGKEGIVYKASETNNGEFVRNVLVKVNALTHYESKSSSKNGMNDDFGAIHIDAGKKVHLKFSFYSEDDEPLTLEVFRITFFDLDEAKGHKSKEYVVGYGKPEVDMASHTVVDEHKLKHGTKLMATKVGSGHDNPDKSTQLTEVQREKSGVMEYKDKHAIEIELGSTKGTAPRAFEFALHSALACKQVQVPDSGAAMTSPAARALAVVGGSALLALGRSP